LTASTDTLNRTVLTQALHIRNGLIHRPSGGYLHNKEINGNDRPKGRNDQ
jgi:hypothetical protein